MTLFLTDTEEDKADRYTIGSKAKNLFRLKHIGMPVPRFVVIPWETLSEALPEALRGADEARISSYAGPVQFGPDFMDSLEAFFGDVTHFAVRSSAADEDGAAFSFAGQLESFLFVPKKEIERRITDVWRSAFSERVAGYREHHQIESFPGLGVIIQEMVDADASGVAFGANPVNGNRDQKLINAVYGLGEGLVSGQLDADLVVMDRAAISYTPALKNRKLGFDRQNLTGTAWTEIPAAHQNGHVLTNAQIHRLGEILEELERELQHPQDIEFAVKGGALYLLQTRPITTLKTLQTARGNYILWDNSNIIESYPGVTTPLTFSFISKSYEVAYKLFSSYLGVSDDVIRQNENVFANTLGFLNGRVYYNLKSWYLMLAMLPGYSINARFMEKMMGVKEQFDIPGSYRLSKEKAWRHIVKMAVQMLFRFIGLPKKRREFMQLVSSTISEYKAIDFSQKSAHELMHLYRDFERKLLLEWKAPLLNDFFAMIWFGMLQKQCERLQDRVQDGVSDGIQDSTISNLHNDLLCGSRDIISVEPVHRSIEIAADIADNPKLKALFISESEAGIIAELNRRSDPVFVKINEKIGRYLRDFGERCVGELKLETISFGQEPSRFVGVLKSYVETGLTRGQFSTERENLIRQQAEKQIDEKLAGSPFRLWKLRQTLRYTRELVSARENLRYERTRAFGIVRELFSFMGKRFKTDGILESDRDIFFLTKEEIFSYLEGTAVTQDLRALVALRRREFEAYKKAGPLSERFATYGAPYCDNDFFSTAQPDTIEGHLKGTGCSPGRVTGRVRVVHDPTEVASLDGDILVTTSTDPGWVILFPGASGIIVERGSLLSHSAIVSREMGKPCIVGVTGLMKTLKTGDRVEMDGSTGIIKVLGVRC
ncbi:MAG: phosphoenolpyruvate synthase [Cytophagaceae bacterium SCN 52-12]|nr:MAG: phosphoenolpyruvate synthase [Cytophagaceae bacterium SCN 52-12]